MAQLHDHLQAEMRYTQEKQEEQANTSRNPDSQQGPRSGYLQEYQNGLAQPCKKLHHKRLDPFTINQIVIPYPDWLSILSSMKIHPVIHISLLEPAIQDPVPRQIMPPPLPVEIDGHAEWQVEEILDSRTRYRKLQ